MNVAKNTRCIMLVDTGAIIMLMKIKHLKGDKLIYDEKVTLIDATGQTTDTLGVIKVSVPLGNKLIRHKIYIVKDDFSIRNPWSRFHAKTRIVTHWDYPTKRLSIAGTIFKLFLEELRDYACPVGVINTTNEEVEIRTSHVHSMSEK